MSKARLFAGVWRSGSDPYYLWVSDWNSFHAKWEELSKQNLRLVDLKVSTDSGKPRFGGVWRAGTDAHYLWIGADWKHFHDKWDELSKQNLRLVDLEVYTEGGANKFAGVWRGGSDAHYLWVGADWNHFKSKWEELGKQNLRLIDIEVYREGGSTRYAGVWRAGSDAHYLWVGVDWKSFNAKWKEQNKQNLRLVDLEIYDEGGTRKYAGVWRAGSDAHYLWVGVDWENFTAKWHELAKSNLRLTSMEFYGGHCEGECSNQILMPSGTYNYAITGHSDVYHWPNVDFNGSERYVRLSALTFDAQPFTIPFSDAKVKRRGTWLYSPGSWHHAIDYSRDDGATFEILAAAAGKVIHIGWDNWSGNTIVVSHDVGGTDTFRTIYMHMRDGPLHDCDASWNNTVNTLGEPRKSQFKTYLSKTGCPATGKRNLQSKYWGTDAHKIDHSLLNKKVARGAKLGWAGNTAPGGCGCTSDKTDYEWKNGSNTHLHIFFCRRDTTNNAWYFIDPYGIYGPPSCYPAKITDPITTPCARYPIAWKGGKPQYP
jgi:polyglycine hydrolase-like protein/peptidase M23-like protein